MELHLKTIGIVSIALSLIHLDFPKRFNWKAELKTLSLINRQLMEVHTFFIGLILFLSGLLCYFLADEIVGTHLGRQLSLGFFLFWGCRLYFQFFVYSPLLWKGKKFETTVHVLFSLLWTYFTTVFFLIFIGTR